MSNATNYISESTAATTALTNGVRGFNAWDRSAMGHIDSAIELDPQFTAAHAVKGLIMMGARHVRFAPIVEACLKNATTHVRPDDPIGKCYLDVLKCARDGNLSQAVLMLETWLMENPTDLFAHRIVQQELFWTGEARWMRDIARRADSAWTSDHPEYSGFLSVLAFSSEEAGDHEAAERYGRAAVALDPHTCWGAHAVAHVLEMKGRSDDGVTWLENLCGNWEQANQISHHLWWHLCLFLLEKEQHERILELLDTQVRNPDSELVQAMPDLYIDLQNLASMLMRLELRGVDIGNRWLSIAQQSAERIDNHTSPFTSAHAVMTLAAVGDFIKAEELIRSMQAFGDTSSHSLAPRMAAAALPAARAAILHRKQDYDAVVKTLMPSRRELWRMGGSHAQRDVFVQILFDACQKTGQWNFAQLILHDMAQNGFSDVNERTLYRQAS